MGKGKYNLIFSSVALVLVFSMWFVVDSSYGRQINWSSVELMYMPLETEEYHSDCLCLGGQTIAMSNWGSEQNQKIVIINITGPLMGEVSTEEGNAAVLVSLDDTTAMHLQAEIFVSEDTIQLTLSRSENAPGLLETTTMNIHVEWHGLEGIVSFAMEPYGDVVEDEIADAEDEQTSLEQEITEDIEDETSQELEITQEQLESPEQQGGSVVTGLIPVTSHDSMDIKSMVAHLKINVDTQSDFMITFLINGTRLERVRWSLDGENYTLLYDMNELVIQWPYVDEWDGTLYLDFGSALEQGQTPTIVVEPVGYERYEITPVPYDAPSIQGVFVKQAELPHVVDVGTTWGTAELRIDSVLILDEKLQLVADDSMEARITEKGVVLSGSNMEQPPRPGTYRIKYSWVWNNVIVGAGEFTVFLNGY